MSGKSDKLDDAVDKALEWATQILDIQILPADPAYLKVQQLKAQAAGLVGQIKARVDPGGMRGGKGDRVGEVLAQRLKDAKAAEKPN